MTNKLLALYGLKWNPFSPDVPVEALWRYPQGEHFCWRMESLVREGGFALITGDPGTGKSVALRILAAHLASLPDVQAGVLTRPQSGLGDFYRELGQLFGVALVPHNRWAGFKALRQTWLTHVEATRYRPVLLIDEAQEMPASVLAELRIPAVTGLPFGHVPVNTPWPVGVRATIDGSRGEVRILERGVEVAS